MINLLKPFDVNKYKNNEKFWKSVKFYTEEQFLNIKEYEIIEKLENDLEKYLKDNENKLTKKQKSSIEYYYIYKHPNFLSKNKDLINILVQTKPEQLKENLRDGLLKITGYKLYELYGLKEHDNTLLLKPFREILSILNFIADVL